MAREGAPLNVIQCQQGHANLGITSYLQRLDNGEIVETVGARAATSCRQARDSGNEHRFLREREE